MSSPKLFFPNSDPWVGTLEAFAIYAVGFVARPVGAAIFGHYGDRIGRKSTLIATLLLMGLATFAVALVPTLMGAVGWLYGAVALTLGLAFIGHAVTVWRAADDASGHGPARRVFLFSLIYLAALFAAMGVDRALLG